MDNLHFIPNNILTKNFKELKKHKNDYQQYLNYIYIYELYFVSYFISLSVSIHMHGVTSQFIYEEGIVLKELIQNLRLKNKLYLYT